MHPTANLVFRRNQEKTFLMLGGLFFFLGVLVFPAQAHHPWDAVPKETFSIYQGFLSGLGHPLLGIDHLL